MRIASQAPNNVVVMIHPNCVVCFSYNEPYALYTNSHAYTRKSPSPTTSTHINRFARTFFTGKPTIMSDDDFRTRLNTALTDR